MVAIYTLHLFQQPCEALVEDDCQEGWEDNFSDTFEPDIGEAIEVDEVRQNLLQLSKGRMCVSIIESHNSSKF